MNQGRKGWENSKMLTAGLKTDTGWYESEDLRSSFGFYRRYNFLKFSNLGEFCFKEKKLTELEKVNQSR